MAPRALERLARGGLHEPLTSWRMLRMYRLNDRVYAKLCVCASLRAYSLRNIKSMASRKGAIVCASHWLVCSFDACSCVSGQDRRT